MKKFFYIANVRLPTEKAHGIQIMKMCEAFVKNGIEIELVVPNRRNDIKEDPFDYYDVKRVFKIRRLWCLDFVRLGRIGYWIEILTFAERVTWYALFKRGIFYTREEFLGFYLKLLGKKVIWEAHRGHKNFYTQFLIRTAVPIVSITNGLKYLYLSMGVQKRNIIVAPDGVDLEKFRISDTRAEIRKSLELNRDNKIVMYAGSRQAWKGVETLEKAASKLREAEVLIISNKPHNKIPLYLVAADVLVIPNSAKDDMSKLYTSPMKLFEYMASRKPIIASDIPSLREILDDSCAYFFEPDNPDDLANKIEYALKHGEESTEKAEEALSRVSKYSWHNRAENILKFINV
jgi:glycosyltransferase involved in cell wall biosynthesis